MKVSKTRNGLRLSQHGVVISEMRLRPGPTHSLFDVLAALVTVFRPQRRVGLLGFAGGGMIAPLRALGLETPIDAVDLDAASFELFKRHCHPWAGAIHWHHREASAWLRDQPKRSFELIVEDLSVPAGGDVFKPEVSWGPLPQLIRERLNPGGTAIFNLIKPSNGRWNPGLNRVLSQFHAVRTIRLQEYENVIVVAGRQLPDARALGASLRAALHKLRSRQTERVQVSGADPAVARARMHGPN